MCELAGAADVLFGDHRDINLLLGHTFSGDTSRARRRASEAAFEAFPNLGLMASTVRLTPHVSGHILSVRVDAADESFETEPLVLPGVVDRVGSGDAFTAGILHADRTGATLAEIAESGLAFAALKHSVLGDMSRITARQFAASSAARKTSVAERHRPHHGFLHEDEPAVTDAPDPQSYERERIAMIDAEEQALALPRFGVDDSWWLGCRLRALAIERGLSIAIEIRRGPTLLFSCLTGIASQDQFEWIRRKVAVALRFERSSYAIGLRCALSPAMFQRSGLTFEHHVAAGGAVPVRLEGTGVIGVVAISGLPQEEDHRLAVKALRELQERLRGPHIMTGEA